MIAFEVSQVDTAPEPKQALDRDQSIQSLLHQPIEAKSEGRVFECPVSRNEEDSGSGRFGGNGRREVVQVVERNNFV